MAWFLAKIAISAKLSLLTLLHLYAIVNKLADVNKYLLILQLLSAADKKQSVKWTAVYTTHINHEGNLGEEIILIVAPQILFRAPSSRKYIGGATKHKQNDNKNN